MIQRVKRRKLSRISKDLKTRGKGCDRVFEFADEEDIIDPSFENIGEDEEENFKINKYNIEEVDSDEENDSDLELQEALLSGKLKPGLHAEVPVKAKEKINNVEAMNSKIDDLKTNLKWIECLDFVSSVEDLPPNVENPLKDSTDGNLVSISELDLVRNDIKRELNFSQQARATVFKALQRLHKLKVPTKRPEDYITEMLKSEQHMNKIEKKKTDKLIAIERKEKAQVLREQKKLGKKIQVEVLQQRQKEKKEFNEKVKKFRSGQIKNTDFLEEKPERKGKRRYNVDIANSDSDKKNKKQKLSNKEFKQSKYGYGGIKRDKKKNTADSSASFNDFKGSKHSVVGKKKSNKFKLRAKKQKK